MLRNKNAGPIEVPCVQHAHGRTGARARDGVMPNFPHEMLRESRAMLREIWEQPEALQRTIFAYLYNGQLRPDVARSLSSWANPSGEVLIAASGSSRHSGLFGEILL